ncbi:MAG: sulfotransferase [Pseudomonadales bacterium]|nr:sulfotransferase [Pseudomonadales bacterium]
MNDSNPTPIFIVGMPRSGSSLFEQMLGLHSKIMPLGEVNWVHETYVKLQKSLGDSASVSELYELCLQRESHEKLRKTYFANLRKDISEPVVVDKLVGNIAYLHAIRAAFPDALVVFMTRDRNATIWSCFKSPFISGHRYSERIEECSAYYDSTEKLMHHWAVHYGDRLITVAYEDLVDNPEREIRRILEKAGLKFEPVCLSPESANRIVKTASRHQVAQPIYRDANRGWLPYAGFVEQEVEKS